MKLETGHGFPSGFFRKDEYTMYLSIGEATVDEVHKVLSLIGKKVVILGELGEDK